MSNKPITERTGDIFKVSYPEDSEYNMIEMKFSRWDKRSGAQYVELDVHVQGRDSDEHNGTVNITSTRGKNEAAKRCADSYPHLPWGEIIDPVCKVVLDLYRKGDPVVNLKDVEVSEGALYMLEPFITLDADNLIYGNGGLGKSWICLFFAALVSAGKSHARLNPEPGSILYLDYETGEASMTKRFDALCRGLDMVKPDFHYRRMRDSMYEDQETLFEMIQEYNVSLIIIDSAAAASGGKAEESQAALNYFRAIRATGITTLTIAHVSKEAEKQKDNKSPFGSVFWYNNPRNIWHITQGNTFTRQVKQFGLFNTKSSDSAGYDPVGLEFTFDDPKNAKVVTVRGIDITDNDDLAEGLPLHDRIAAFIQEQRDYEIERPFRGVPIAMIKEELGNEASNAISRVNKQRKKAKMEDKFYQVSHGVWDITSQRRKDVEQYRLN